MNVRSEPELKELFVQIAICIPPKNFNKFKMIVIELLEKQQEEVTTGSKKELFKLVSAQTMGDTSIETQKLIDKIRGDIRKYRVCSKMKNLKTTLLGITHDGGASSKAASKSFDATVRGDKTKSNYQSVNAMNVSEINEYLETIDRFIMGQIKPGHNLDTMLNEVASNSFIKPCDEIASLHSKCNELDGFTVSILSETIEQNNILTIGMS